jgi:translation initiation factor IF-1
LAGVFVDRIAGGQKDAANSRNTCGDVNIHNSKEEKRFERSSDFANEAGETQAIMIFFGVPSSKVVNCGRIPEFFSGSCLQWAGMRVEARRAMPDATIHAHGQVLESLSPVLCRVALPNGKIILAHASKCMVDQKTVLAVSDRVRLEFTPYDFDTARILNIEN